MRAMRVFHNRRFVDAGLRPAAPGRRRGCRRDAGRDRPDGVVRQPASGLCVESRRDDLAGDLWVRKPCLSPCGGSRRHPERILSDPVGPRATRALRPRQTRERLFRSVRWPYPHLDPRHRQNHRVVDIGHLRSICEGRQSGAERLRPLRPHDGSPRPPAGVAVATSASPTPATPPTGETSSASSPTTIIDPTHATCVCRHRSISAARAPTLGAVFTNRLDNQGGTVRSVEPVYRPRMPALPTLAPVTAGTTPISVPVNQTRSLGPGAYGLVHVDGTLTLTGGTYQLARLELGTGGRVEASAGAKIRVAGAIAGRTQLSPAHQPGGLGPRFAGRGDRHRLRAGGVLRRRLGGARAGDGAARLRLVFHPRAQATGAFVARDIAVSPSVVVQYEGGLPGRRRRSAWPRLQVTSDQVVPWRRCRMICRA